MALVNCPECKKEYSDKLKCCPHCGYEVRLFLCPECGSIWDKEHGKCTACKHTGDEETIQLIPATAEQTSAAYETAVEAMKHAESENEWEKLENQFRILCPYKEAEQLEKICQEKYIQAMTCVEIGEQLRAASDLQQLTDIKQKLENLGGSKAANALLAVCTEKMQAAIYAEAETLYEHAEKRGDYKKLIHTYESILEYQDAKDKYDICQEKYAEKTARLKKRAIGATIAGVVAVALIGFFVGFVQPKLTYNAAVTAYENKDYKTAAEKFSKIKNNKEAAEQARESYFEYGKECIAEQDYETAAEMFENAGHYENAVDYMHYAKGMISLEQKEYEDAIKCFMYAKQVEDGKARYGEANYNRGLELMKEEKYESALQYFKTAGNYEGAKEQRYACRLMEAEKYWDAGKLNAANRIYKSLPKSFKYHGISVAERRAQISKHSDFLGLCGSWNLKSGEAKTQRTSKSFGDYNWWTMDLSGYDKLEITCQIQDNGEVQVNGSGATLYLYDDFSSISEYLDLKSRSISFSKTLTSAYDTIEVDSNTTITFDGNQVKLRYLCEEDNRDLYFTYTFTTVQTYKK